LAPYGPTLATAHVGDTKLVYCCIVTCLGVRFRRGLGLRQCPVYFRHTAGLPTRVHQHQMYSHCRTPTVPNAAAQSYRKVNTSHQAIFQFNYLTPHHSKRDNVGHTRCPCRSERWSPHDQLVHKLVIERQTQLLHMAHSRRALSAHRTWITCMHAWHGR